MVYWNHPYESGAQPLKVNLIIYENDVLQVVGEDIPNNDDNIQVTGSSFFLWVIDNYCSMADMVQTIMTQVEQIDYKYDHRDNLEQEKNAADEGIGQDICKAKE